MTAGASNADATSFLTFANGPTLNQDPKLVLTCVFPVMMSLP